MKQIIVFLTAILVVSPLRGERLAKLPAYEAYVKQYSSLAVGHQKKYHIPASITLAQGILESGGGLSELARKSNNHFGIKCHADWKGEKVYHDDDRRNECFRKYKNVEDSYEDHALFLTGSARYANLFKLDIKNYRGWAKGLQESGYATDPAYANRLIKLIEDYELYRYDSGRTADAPAAPKETPEPAVVRRPAHNTLGLDYIYAEENDSFDRIAAETGLTVEQLIQYNETPADFPLQKGDIVYLEKKNTRAAKPHYDHVVQIGESMHSISQKYGMRMKNLYKINKKKDDYVPVEGDVLKLR
ncbi:MAG: glucosaminidase domain-containing protein [Tannerellaceae bacterium]|nr:glucosaminidase domain-containing protein [Tannerellaceae bacterium]